MFYTKYYNSEKLTKANKVDSKKTGSEVRKQNQNQ